MMCRSRLAKQSMVGIIYTYREWLPDTENRTKDRIVSLYLFTGGGLASTKTVRFFVCKEFTHEFTERCHD